MGDLYKCSICKQIHSDGGTCYGNAIKRIKQLEAELIEWKSKYFQLCETQPWEKKIKRTGG